MATDSAPASRLDFEERQLGPTRRTIEGAEEPLSVFATALFVRLVRKLEARFPSLLVGVRAGRGFCSPRLLDALDLLNVELGKVSYVLGVEKNAVLCHLVAEALAEAKAESEETKRAARRCT